jgi:hypothetical protein
MWSINRVERRLESRFPRRTCFITFFRVKYTAGVLCKVREKRGQVANKPSLPERPGEGNFLRIKRVIR